MRKIKIKKRTAKILNWVFSVAFLALAFWVDWRIGLAFIAYDLSSVFTDIENDIKANERAGALLAIIRNSTRAWEKAREREKGNGTQTTTT